MFSSICLLKMLTSSFVPLEINHMFTLRFLAAGVQSLSHLLRFSRSRIALTLFQERPFAAISGSFDIIVVKGKEMEGNPLTPSL